MFNKFIGHGIVIGTFVISPILYNFGLENTLYLVGSTLPYTYSDMNGHGHFAPALFLVDNILALDNGHPRRRLHRADPARLR